MGWEVGPIPDLPFVSWWMPVAAATPANTSGRELLEVLSAPATVGPSRATMPNSAAPPRQERRTHLTALVSLTAYSPRRGMSQGPHCPGFDDPDAESLPCYVRLYSSPTLMSG